MEMIIQNFTYEDACILIMQTEQSVEDLISELSNFEDYKTEFLAIKNEKRKREFLTVRIAMNILIKKNVIVYHDENQKPYLSGCDWKISISHSHDYVALIAHPYAEVGIDIECRTKKVAGVYQRFLNKEEQTYFFDNENTGLLEIAWSAKEVLFKILGKKVHDFAGQLHLFPFILQENGTLKAKQTSDFKLYNLHYLQNNKFTLVYCIDKN